MHNYQPSTYIRQWCFNYISSTTGGVWVT
jgi:hypothetical protein